MDESSVLPRACMDVDVSLCSMCWCSPCRLLEVTEDMLKQIQESQFDPGTRTMSNMSVENEKQMRPMIVRDGNLQVN